MKIKKIVLAVFITVAMLLTQIPVAFAAGSAPTEQFSLTPGDTYYFDLSAQGIPGAVNADALKWVPFTYAGTVNAYSLTGINSGISSSSNNATVSDRSLFVAEYNISVGKSWDNFDAVGLIFGKNYNSGGIAYTIRSLSAGNSWNSSNLGVPASNEWDQILNKNSAFIKNWNTMSYGQDTMTSGAKYRVVRGVQFAGFCSYQLQSAMDSHCGLRPALQIQNPSALGTDGLKTVTFDMDGNGTLGDKALTSATVVYTGKLTLPALTKENGFNYTGAGKSGWNIGTTFYEPGTSVDLPSGTVLKAGCKYDSEQLNLPIGTYFFDLSAQNIPGTKNSALPDSSLKWVPFTYAGTVNAYSRIGAGASTDQTVSVNKRSLFVADYNVTNAVSWDALNNNGLIFGKAYSKGSVNYLLRSLSAGSNITGSGNSLRGLPLTNEWDQILDKDMDFIKNTSEMYSWGQDTNLLAVGERYLRGYQSLPNGVWSCSASAMLDTCGFRPILEILNPDTLGTNGLKTVTFNMGNQGTIGDKKTLTSATVVYTGELTLPAITEANGFYYTGIGTGTLGWYSGSTFYAPGATPNLAKGTILTPGYGTAPTITGPTTMTLTEGYSATSTGAYTITGSAPVIVSKTSGDASITWNNSTKKLDIVAGLAAGSYPVTFTACNGALPDATVNFTLTVNPTYKATVTPSSNIFNAGTEGYSEQASQNFIISSTGTGTITGLNASLTDGSKFEISDPLTSETILPGGTAAVKVRPKTGLPVGTHTANLKIEGNNGLSVTIGLSFKVNALVNTKSPVITLDLTDKTTNVGAPVTLDATATVSDGGSPTYEWYSNTTRSTSGATQLGVTTSTYSPDVSSTGTTYYYCVVTNTNNSVTGAKTATITSAIAEVKVSTAPPPAPVVTGVTVTPDTITVQKGNTQSFSAVVTGTNNPAQTVAWSVSGNTSTNTTIDTSGVLTVAADETVNTLTVTAVSTADNTKSGTAAVTVSTATPPAPPPAPVVIPVIPPVSLYNADVTGTDISKTNLPVTVDSNTDSAAVDMGSIRQDDIFANGGTTVITIPSISGVDTYTLGIPIAYLSIPDVKGTLKFSTAAGSMILPANMLAGVEGSEGKKAEISISKADANNLPDDVKAEIGDRPVIELAVTLDGKRTEWNNPQAPVKLSIPYTPTASELLNPEAIVIWYIDGSGKAVSIPNGCYDPKTGIVTFSTTHFSCYAIGYNKVSFKDVSEDEWYSKAVGFIAARGITTGAGNGLFYPGEKLTRGQFIVMVLKAYGISPDQNPTENFSDAGNTYYTNYLATAKRLGISGGVGNNRFAPDNQITRQEMFVLLYNALKATGKVPEVTGSKTLVEFSDGGQVASWARDAMTFFVQKGTISGNGGKLSPVVTTSRAEMAQVLYNLLSR